MKKIIAILIAVMLIASMTVPVSAYGFSWWKYPTKTAEAAEPGVSDVTEARYHHSGIVRLQIDWEAVAGAESYVVLIVRADGVTEAYTTETNMLWVKNTECPKVFIEDTDTWTSATVFVAAVSGGNVGGWSDPVKIGCDMLH